MRIDIERVHALRDEIVAINKLDLKDIEVYEGGKRILMDQKVVEEWIFTGLSNFLFFDMQPWVPLPSDEIVEMGDRAKAIAKVIEEECGEE
jgi:hypothetical protein